MGMDEKVSKKKSEEIGINSLNSISNLEANIMKIIWERGKATVREVHEIMLRQEMEKKQHGFIPYTTVMSTMNTLAEMGLREQDRRGKSNIYSAAVTKTELARSIIKSVAEKILEGTPQLKKVDRFIDDLS